MDLRLPSQGSSSRQARYHLVWVIEGNTLDEMTSWLGDVDRLIESGRTIGITRRIITRSSGSPVIIIVWSNLRGVLKSKDNPSYRWCCCWTLNLYQERRLKTVRWVSRGEDILKGCDRGITPGCQVFWISKGFEAWRRPHPGINPQSTKITIIKVKFKNNNRKCRLVKSGSCPHSLGLSLAIQIRKILSDSSEKFIGCRSPNQVANLGKQSKWRVAFNSKIG